MDKGKYFWYNVYVIKRDYKHKTIYKMKGNDLLWQK